MLVFLIPLFVLLSSPVFAAVNCADANAVAIENGTPVNPITTSYTLPSGSDFFGVMVPAFRAGGGALTISNPAWGASTPTALTTAQYSDPNGSRLFTLVAPPSGTQTVSAQFSASGLANALAAFVCTGVDQANPTHDATQTSGSSATAAVTVSNVTAADVVVVCVSRNGGTAMTGSGSLVQIVQASSPSEMNIGCWYQPGSAGGSVSVALNASNGWTIHAFALNASATADFGFLMRRGS